MQTGKRLADIRNIDKLLDEIEKAILTAHSLNMPFLAHLLGMAFWEAKLNADKHLEPPAHRREHIH